MSPASTVFAKESLRKCCIEARAKHTHDDKEFVQYWAIEAFDIAIFYASKAEKASSKQ